MKKSILQIRFENRNKFENEKRLSISGSRSLKDERVRILILEQIEKHKVTRITTHAEPGGVCEIARILCKENAIPLTLHYLDFKKLRGAFYHRSLAVFYDTDIALFIHDGISKGCQNEYELAKKMNIPSEYFILEKAKYETSTGFDVEENEWLGIDDVEMEEIDIDGLFEKL